ncbi:MAG: AAA family ATPase [Acidobacteria bacterium]|jgi:pilus assembly protein CpaE|nr:AAA family ATPase [Acidobacteriota bacterium]
MSETLSANDAIATFTVCADAALNGLIEQLPERLQGVAFAGEFQHYISTGQRPQFPQSVRKAPGCVAWIDFDQDQEAALETAEVLHRMSAPTVTCVGVASQVETSLLLRAMRHGCSEFHQKPVTIEHLKETVERIKSRIFVQMESSAPRGRIVSFFGAKGGVGTTTLAVHIAAYLAKQHGKKTLLVDHNHQLGHVGLLLGLEDSNYHFDDLTRNVDRLDAELLSGFLIRHASGLAVLSSPSTCSVRYHAMPEDLERIFEFLRQEFDFVVIDSSLQYDDAPAMIQYSDSVYLVSTPDVAALRDLSRHIEHLGLTEVPADKLRVAINRSASQDAIGQEQIEKVVKFPVSVSIPNNYGELLRAVNAGEPIWPQRRSEFTSRLTRWAHQLAGEHDGPSALSQHAPRKRFSFWKTEKVQE